MTKFILIRHGQTSWTEERRYQGRSDTELSETGIRKMRELARQFHKLGTDSLYASSLKRAIQSARILAGGRLNFHIDSRICEIDFGKWEGKTAEELLRLKDKAFLAWTQKQKWVNPPGGESRFDFCRRVRIFFQDCLKKHSGKTVAIVSHGGPIRLMILEALRLPFKFFFSFRIEPASVSIVSADPKRPGQILLLNSSRIF